MKFYPDDCSNSDMSQAWHGKKWLTDVPDDMLSPMIVHTTSCKHYYVQELTKCANDRYFIPERWVTKKGAMWALGRRVKKTTVRFLIIRFLLFNLTVTKH